MFRHLRLLPWPTQNPLKRINCIFGQDMTPTCEYSGPSSIPNQLLRSSMRVPFKSAREPFYIYSSMCDGAEPQPKQTP